jgi:hypothetical protein
MPINRGDDELYGGGADPIDDDIVPLDMPNNMVGFEDGQLADGFAANFASA